MEIQVLFCSLLRVLLSFEWTCLLLIGLLLNKGLLMFEHGWKCWEVLLALCLYYCVIFNLHKFKNL